MKRSKQIRTAGKSAKAHAPIPKAPAARSIPWEIPALATAALIVAFLIYGPALNGPFLFDDRYLPFLDRHLIGRPFSAWLIGLRPFVNLSFWFNAAISGSDTWSYHALNVVLHAANSVLVFVIARWFLRRVNTPADRLNLLSAIAGALFLAHPLQSEAVAYITGRSETLAVFFFYAAFALFLYRRKGGIRWLSALGVLALFAAAQLTKEYAIVFPLLLLLTDWLFPEEQALTAIAAVKRNWRLYGLLVAGAAIGAFLIVRVLKSTNSAGFHLKAAGPWQYLLTECRAIWVYLRLVLLPFGQNVDADFPFSRGLTPLAAAALLGLVALTVAAFIFRKRYTLAAFGFFATLLCLAPTSSFLPLSDPFAEHRMYLPMFGVVLITLDFLRRWKVERSRLLSAASVVLLLCAYLTYARSALWGDEIALWQNALDGSPQKVRPRFQLAFSYYRAGRCANAVDEYQKAAQLKPPSLELLQDWGEAADCAGDERQALALFRQAERLHTNIGLVESQIGMVLAKQKRYDAALAELDKAQQRAPGLAPIYAYRGNIYFAQGAYVKAVAAFQRALQIDGQNRMAIDGIIAARRRLGASPQ
ncbi:MAG TPA: tetratricopeptide repeat protein [Bryobacteraceae bacterium]|jgi:tetratricopeptide (TPR) repeat protein|nr:tetratricopeptide repeat protein [Bryobacteraceae bacterium]